MTDIYILNTDYQVVGIVDNYSSAIFTRVTGSMEILSYTSRLIGNL